MKKYLIVTADQNDADYITEKSSINDKQLKLIEPVIKALQERKKLFEKDKNWSLRHNWVSGERSRGNDTPEDLYVKTGLLTKKQIALFNEYIPYGENGIHTIISVEVLVVQEEETLFSI